MANATYRLPDALALELNWTNSDEDAVEYMSKLLALVEKDLDEERFYRYAALVAAYATIFVVSIVGNVLVCHVTFQRKAQKNLTNLALGNLAISDLLITFFNVPFGCARLVMDNWIFGQVLCSALPFVQALSVYVSSLTMALIAVDRYQGMMKPLKPKLGDKVSPAWVVSCVWFTATLLAMPFSQFNYVRETFTFRPLVRCAVVLPEPQFLYRRAISLFTFLTQFVIPLSVNGVAYYRVGKRIWLRESVGYITEVQALGCKRDKIKTVAMLMTCFAVFVVCWLPLNVYHMLVDFSLTLPNFKTLVATHLLAMSSTCYNPFIYFWFNDTFRGIIKKKLCCRPEKPRLHKNLTDRNISTKGGLRHHIIRRKTSSAFAMWYERPATVPVVAV